MNTQVAEYSKTEAALGDLRKRFKGMTWDVSTTAGDKDARAARKELVSLRTGLDAKRKEIKAPLLLQCDLIEKEAKRITGEIVALESPIDELIKTEEKRRAEEKAERDRIESERVAEIQERISAIRSVAVQMVNQPSAAIQEALDELSAMRIDELLFGEFDLKAQGDRADAVKALTKMLEATLAQEAEASRLNAEREAFERQQAEQRRIDAEEALARQEAEAKARAEQAEVDRIAAEQRAIEQAKIDADKAELHRQQAEFQAAIDAERERQEAIERAAQEAAAVEQARIDAEAAKVVIAEIKAEAGFTEIEPIAEPVKRPTAEQIINLVASTYKVSADTARGWINQITNMEKAA